MAAPTWLTGMTDLYAEGAATVSAIGSGGAALTNPETDFFIQGTDCVSKGAWTNAIKGMILDNGATFTAGTGGTNPHGAIIVWAYYSAVGSLATKSAGGFRIITGQDSSNYDHWYVGGSDTMAFDSWVPYAIKPQGTGAVQDATTGTPTTTTRWVGVLANLPTTSGPTKGAPIAIDAIRYGLNCNLRYSAGDSANGFQTFDGAEAYANDPSRRYGLIEKINGAFYIQGHHEFSDTGLGSAGAVDFRDSNKSIFIRACANNLGNNAVDVNFNTIESDNAFNNVEWTNIIFAALGTRSRGTLLITDGDFAAESCQFNDMYQFSFTSLGTVTATNCAFRRCDAITSNADSLAGSQFLDTTAAYAVDFNNAVSAAWETTLNGCSFRMGSTNSHALFLSSTTLTNHTKTLQNVDFSGYGVTPGATDAILSFAATTGSVTVNLINCTVDGGAPTAANFSIKTAGVAITLVIDPVDTTVSVSTLAGTPIQDARVYLEAASGGDYSAPVAVNGITRQSTGVADIDYPAHGYLAGEKFVISGITNYTTDNTTQTVFNPTTNTISYVSGLSSLLVYTGDIKVEPYAAMARVGSTVTVTMPASKPHGLLAGDTVKIRGITNATEDNPGTHTVLASGLTANVFTYTSNGTGDLTYTGDTLVRAVIIDGLTDVNGDIVDNRSYTSDQPITGRIRKSTSSPYYKTTAISGTVSRVNGLTIETALILDE